MYRLSVLNLSQEELKRIRNEGYIGYSVFLVCLELEFCSWITHGQENDLAVDMEWDESPDIDKRLETRDIKTSRRKLEEETWQPIFSNFIFFNCCEFLLFEMAHPHPDQCMN